ncbi:MAG: hypothetical protein ACRD3D_07690, partial [Terriglobia bacterium]
MTENAGRRQFLRSIAAGVPATAAFGATASARAASQASLPDPERTRPSLPIPLASEMAGDDAIPFRKHTLDLGICEAVTVVDMNGDGRLDIVSGENWYEQLPPERGAGPRFIKHKFRELPYTNFYLEDLSDLAIDVTGDG